MGAYSRRELMQGGPGGLKKFFFLMLAIKTIGLFLKDIH